MKTVDMIVKTRHLFTMEGDGVGYLENTAMIIDRGRIIDFVPTDAADDSYRAEEVLALFDHAVLPGLIDAHTHVDICIARGLAQDTDNWMFYGLQPFENAMVQEDIDASVKLGIMEAIKAGTTTIGEFSIGIEPACKFINQSGIRGNITETVRSLEERIYHPGELYEFNEDKGKRSLENNIAMYDKWHDKDHGRIKILFGPQGADFMSRELLLQVREEAKKRNTKIHMHLQQGTRETEQIMMRYGKRPVEWLKEIGYLDESLIGVHLADCTDEEAEFVAESGAGMIVCPGSIGIIDGIVCPSMAFQNAGGYVALGSDQAPGNNCHNVFNEMKLAALFNKISKKDPEVMPAWKVLRMATIEGAKALGMDQEIGSLACGKKADFIAVDLKKLTMQPIFTKPMRNIVPNLVYSARGNEVILSVVDGKIIYKDQILLNVDEEACLAEIESRIDCISERAEKEFEEIAGTNYIFMQEGKL